MRFLVESDCSTTSGSRPTTLGWVWLPGRRRCCHIDRVGNFGEEAFEPRLRRCTSRTGGDRRRCHLSYLTLPSSDRVVGRRIYSDLPDIHILCHHLYCLAC